MSANKILFRVALAVSAASMTLAFSSCKKAPPEEAMVQKVSDDSLKLSDDAIKNIKLVKVSVGDFPEKLALMGRISVPEDRTVVVPSRVTGRMDQIFVASGEVVTAGQPLASIFSADFAIAKEEYIQAVKQVQSTPSDEESKHLLELSKKKLSALGVSEADISKWDVTKSDESVQGARIVVHAPISGALLGKQAVIGTLQNVGDTLFMIGDLSKVWFAGDIYPEDLRKVKKNQEVVIDPGNGATALHGKVSFISPVIDPNSRTIKIRALMDNPGSQLRADMYVQGDVILSLRRALVAPKSALVRLQDDVFCFKRLPGNIFKKVSIKVDGDNDDTVAVTQGLSDGDEVVSEGGLLLDAALHGAGT
jgi:Cu(I)/Ag(I) efflux system membrane fusion protein